MVRLVSADDGVRGGLLVWDDVAPEPLREVLVADSGPQWVALLPPAAQLADVVSDSGWDRQEQRVAMAMPDLSQLTPPPAPPDVVIGPVAVRQSSDGVSLEDAVRLSVLYGEDSSASSRDLGVATLPSYRRRGIGTAITAATLQAAAEAGAREAFLDASPAGVGIYRRLGFAEIGPVCWCERSLGA